MQMKQCKNGHFYDPSKHTACPNCGIPNLDFDFQKTVPERQSGGFGGSEGPGEWPGMQQGNLGQHRTGDQDDNKTVAIHRVKLGIDPVVGWLVCIEGTDKGRDYRIRSEKNFVGRAENMDIYIKGDDSISRVNHAVISYNPKKNDFRIHAGDGRGLVYLNDELVDTSMQLKPYDVIELGQTKLMFVPFCGEQFKWYS